MSNNNQNSEQSSNNSSQSSNNSKPQNYPPLRDTNTYIEKGDKGETNTKR